MASRAKRLRSGYTTGACAAAAAKAALLLLVSGSAFDEVEIPFPDGARRTIPVCRVWAETEDSATAVVRKDAGDDPDVTNGAEVVAKVVLSTGDGADARDGAVPVVIRGGVGVGIVTRPGLAVPVGEAAINPGPRRMVAEAVQEVLAGRLFPSARPLSVEVTICVPDGERLAGKTLNSRLGIVGGISVLGTTGIVKPLSTDAWTATIAASMAVAEAMGRKEVVLSAGRSSERAHMARYGLPEESYVMMGDHVEYAFREAAGHRFGAVHLCAQWGKMLKIAMATPQTHVSHGVIDLARAAAFIRDMGFRDREGRQFQTARAMFGFIASTEGGRGLFSRVCGRARSYAESIAPLPVFVHLVSYEGEMVATDG